MLPQKQLLAKLRLLSPNLMRPPLISHTANGVTSFVPSLCRLSLSLNTPKPGAGGDSIGMQAWVRANLKEFASRRQYVEIVVVHQSGPPGIKAEFNNGSVIESRCGRWSVAKIQGFVEQVADARGKETFRRKIKGPVIGGVATKPWDPFHNVIFRP